LDNLERRLNSSFFKTSSGIHDISGFYSTMVVKLKIWQWKLIEMACEYTEQP